MKAIEHTNWCKKWTTGRCQSKKVPDISTGSVVTHLRCGENLNDDFIMELLTSLTVNILEIGWNLAKS